MKPRGLVMMGISFAAATGIAFAVPPKAHAAYLQNGDFEDFSGTDADPVYVHWDNNGGNFDVSVDDAPSPIQGQHSPEIFYRGGDDAGKFSVMSQTLNDPDGKLTKWVIEFDVAAGTTGDNAQTQVPFSFHVMSDNGGQVFLRLRYKANETDGLADVQLFDTAPDGKGGTTNNATNVLFNAVTLSDSDQSLKVNHFKIVGDYSGATPKYDVYVTDAAGATQFSMDRTEFLKADPPSGSTITELRLDDWHDSPGSWYVVDNVSVNVAPEPGSLALLGLGGLVMLSRRRNPGTPGLKRKRRHNSQ